MICAFISDSEIIPFDGIECITFDEIECTHIAEILFSQSKETIRISGDVERLRDEYTAYLTLMSKAVHVLEDIE